LHAGTRLVLRNKSAFTRGLCRRKVHYRIDVREPRTRASPYTYMPVVVSARHGTRSCATAQSARNLPVQWLAQTEL
jgi:hypothetical protein